MTPLTKLYMLGVPEQCPHRLLPENVCTEFFSGSRKSASARPWKRGSDREGALTEMDFSGIVLGALTGPGKSPKWFSNHLGNHFLGVGGSSSLMSGGGYVQDFHFLLQNRRTPEGLLKGL